MKKIILLLTLFCISFLDAQNSISYEEATINGNKILGNSVENITTYFGSPNSVEDYFYETEDIMTQKYMYNGLTLNIHNNKVVDFKITGSTFNFTKHNIKPGDFVSTIEKFFPLSYRERGNNALSIRFKDIDKFIVVTFDSNLKIDKIWTGSY